MQEFLEILRSTARGMWAHRWLGLASAIAVGLVGIGISFLIPSRFEATARVYVDTQSLLRPLLKDMAVQPNVEQQVSMMARIILSRPNIDKVMKASDLDLQVKTPAEREKFIDDLTKEIEFKIASGGSNLYQIAYKNTKPDAAKAVVQSVLGIFIEQGLGNGRDLGEQAIRFLNSQIKEAEQKLLGSETALKDFKIKNLNVMPNLQQDSLLRATESQNAVSQARLELRQAEYARDSLRKQLNEESATLASNDSAYINNDVVSQARLKPSELDERIETAKKRMDELRSRFTDEHPDVIGMKRVLTQLDEQRVAERKADEQKVPPTASARAQNAKVSAAANPVYQQIKLSLAETEAQVASLRARVNDYESRLIAARESAQTIPKVEAEYLQLTRDYESIKKNYDQLVQRKEVALLSSEMNTGTGVAEYRVVDPPRTSSKPIWPNRPLLLALALICSIAAGLATCFLKDQSKPTFFDARGLRQATGIPMLGAVSHVLDAASRSQSLRKAWLFTGVSSGYFLTFLALLVWVWLRTYAR
jgi:polysaccharide chain length determinant protein (PEP-CTERM system associated)